MGLYPWGSYKSAGIKKEQTFLKKSLKRPTYDIQILFPFTKTQNMTHVS